MNKLFIIILASLLLSCNPDLEDARMVKQRMSTKELKYVMGEPWRVEINLGYEEWYFNYYLSMNQRQVMVVKVRRDTVYNFYSY